MDESPSTRERIIEVAERLLFQQGFSGTSLNNVMNAASLSKGAFFHHFKNKQELAFAVLGRWADRDDDLVQKFATRANTLADNPLQEAIIFLKLLEEWLSSLDEPSGGCLFASFTYESQRFDPSMHEYIATRLRTWMGLYAGIFERLVATTEAMSHEAKSPEVSGRSLTEMLASIIEGGLLLGRALDDRNYLVRQLGQFRQQLMLLFQSQ
jgi:TetR/AcrR family transcriptional repressor of nem operon